MISFSHIPITKTKTRVRHICISLTLPGITCEGLSWSTLIIRSALTHSPGKSSITYNMAHGKIHYKTSSKSSVRECIPHSSNLIRNPVAHKSQVPSINDAITIKVCPFYISSMFWQIKFPTRPCHINRFSGCLRSLISCINPIR